MIKTTDPFYTGATKKVYKKKTSKKKKSKSKKKGKY